MSRNLLHVAHLLAIQLSELHNNMMAPDNCLPFVQPLKLIYLKDIAGTWHFRWVGESSGIILSSLEFKKMLLQNTYSDSRLNADKK